MSLYKVLWQRLTICLVLGIVIVVQLLVSSKPDSALPALPELMGFALLSGILCVSFGVGRTLQLPGWSFRRSEGAALSFVWLTVLGVTGSRAIVSLFHTPGQVWTPCKNLPGIAVKLECFFQASIYQNYGFRTLFMLVSALMLGTLTCLIARSVRDGWKLLLAAVFFGPLLVTIVGFVCVSFRIDQALPRSLFSNTWGYQRLTQIFANPGWVWPYFAPGLAVVLWVTVTASTWVGRMFGAAISILLILGILATQQRGGLLLCVLYVAVCGFYCLTRGLKQRHFLLLIVSGTVLAVLGSGMYSLLNNQKLLQESAQSIGYGWRPETLSLDPGRLEIWQAAWEIFKQAPLYGYGYASWFSKILEYAQKYEKTNIAYETAHNLFVQMLVELGLLHTGLVLTILVLIAWVGFQNSRFLPGGRLLLTLAVSSFFVPTLVQEINFIRSTFYMHAIFWGTLTGLPFYGVPHTQQYSCRKPDGMQEHGFFPGSTRLVPSIGFALLAGASVVGILYCCLNFSFGGYSFDARLSEPNTKIVRGLGPSVRFASFATVEGKAYSVYDVMPFYSVLPEHEKQEMPKSVYAKEAGSSGITADEPEQIFLALENGGGYRPRMHQLSFEPVYPDNARWLSVFVLYPPQQSNLGIAWSRGMYPWENFAGRAGRWCQKDCVFLAKSCGRRDRLDFGVQSFRPDGFEGDPLSFQVSVYSLMEEDQFAATLLKSVSNPVAKVQAQINKPGEEKHIHATGLPGTTLYLVQVSAESSFNPYAQGLSQDNRDLGVIIHELDCRNLNS